MSPRVHVRRTMARSNLELQIARSPVLRYGLAVLSVSVALGGSLLLERFQYRNVADPLFLFAIAIAVWYAGIGPTILAVVLSGLAGTYFFIEPIYNFFMTRDDLRTLSFSYYLRRFLPGSQPFGGG
jgi:K+-sensing histidine kinase KdpD